MQRSEAAGDKPRRMVVISDFCDGHDPVHDGATADDYAAVWRGGHRGPAPAVADDGPFPVVGGYLERLPLSALRYGLCDVAEIWSFTNRETPAGCTTAGGLTRRSFRTGSHERPYRSADMLGHIAAFGPPDILCVWGLGVDEAILTACASSIKIYNSIDAPALRVPAEVSRHFDIVLTGAEWQSRAVEARHPGMVTAILPIGPEFASPETFFPLGSEKPYDVIYVAAAQGYKRHDILFDALARLPRSVRALCVCGYGELAEAFKARVAELGIDVDFVGPPGVDYSEVNRLMNLARIGVVCGVDDGAPAILTEYQLAGLPVVANAALSCGLQYVVPSTGIAASEEHFHEAILDVLDDPTRFRPRETVLANWSWEHSIEKFAALLGAAGERRPQLLR